MKPANPFALLTTLGVIVLGASTFIGVPARAADDPAASVAALKALGATVTEANGVVTKLVLTDGSKLAEADFRAIGRLTALKSLTLYKCKALTDATLPLLAGLTNLEEISTDSIQVTDDGLKHFEAFKALKSASFFHISYGMKGFTGAGFAHFKALPKLERLTIAGTPFNDEGMAAIGQITQLKDFRTWHTYQTAAGTAQLAKLPALKGLRFGQRLRQWNGKPNPLTLDDAAMDDLAKLAALEALYLDEGRLSYAGLVKLKALTKLKSLTLERILIDAADVEKLKTELAGVTVTYKPVPAEDVAKLEAALKP
jgi:hypothetical protein